MYAKMIKANLEKMKQISPLSSNETEENIRHFLHKECFEVSIQFKSDTDEIETDRFGLFKGCKCPHGKTEKAMCSNCNNFVIHEFDLKYGRTIIPSTSTTVGYCARMKYRR